MQDCVYKLINPLNSLNEEVDFSAAAAVEFFLIIIDEPLGESADTAKRSF